MANPVDLATLKALHRPNSRLLGIDPGTKTLGLALSDGSLRVASPWQTIARKKFSEDAAQLRHIAAEQDKLFAALTKRFGMAAAVARDTMLAGSAGEIRDKLGRLRDAGVGMLFIPTLFMKDARPALDRFLKDIVPQFR